MRLPTLLLRIIDPAQVYFDRVDGGRARPTRRSPPVQRLLEPGQNADGVTYGLRVGEGAPPTDLRRDDPVTDRAVVRERFADQLSEAARGLVTSGHARVQTPEAALDARLITFWRGDGVLEVQRSSASSGGTSRSRIQRARLSDEDTLADYLAARLAQATGSSG